MPRTKKNPDSSAEKKPAVKPKAKAAKPAKAGSAVKKIVPAKKARPVVIDVIEDDEPETIFPELPAADTKAFPFSGRNVSREMEVAEEEEEEEDMEEEIKEEITAGRAADIDQQRKFFSKLVTEMKDKNLDNGEDGADAGHGRNHKRVGLYRRLVWRFIAFTAFLLIVVLYFSFSKLTIMISPKGEVLNDSLLLKVQNGGVGAGQENKAESVGTEGKTDSDFRESVSGTIKELAVSEEKSFSATGEEFTGEEIYGRVTIVNNSGKGQALVATTRLLSSDNKLFRIKNAVDVPAGGETEVEIYAEKPSEDLAIKATTFTIPGLWLGLQDKIYAKSSEDFVFRQKVKKYIKASDIEKATKEIDGLLTADAKAAAGQISEDTEVIYENISPADFEIDAKAGDAKDQFTIKAKGNFAIISFSREEATKLAAAKLSLLVPDDKELVGYNADSIAYTLDNYDSKTGVATIKAGFNGTMILKDDTEIIDKKQLVNLNRQQLENYLKSFPEIKEYELIFFPSFVNRAPRLPERIKIEIRGLGE